MASANASVRTMWALGDYHRFATATVWEVGPVLIDACEIGPGQRVVASAVTPEQFDAGRRAARELLRVCRPGGVIGLMNFTPDGGGGDFFRTLAPHALPAPHGAQPALLWGTEDHVRNLFGGAVQSLACHRGRLIG